MLEKTASDKSATDVVGMSLTEEFLAKCYEFRRNVLSDKYEMREAADPSAEGTDATVDEKPWRTVTRESINTMARRMKRELGKECGSKSFVEEYIYSEETPDYDPIAAYFNQLPAWDGKDRVRDLFLRLPEVSEVQIAQLSVWLRSCVAHWLHIDHLHGNEQIFTLIGPQGSGKSTYCAQLLPEPLRVYYLDHVNLANKFDKDMALTNNLLVNIDELDQIKAGKQPELKQLVSKIIVNGRPIFGKAQRERLRYASFVATTNNPRPLQDKTGSRRYLCVQIPQDTIICNDRPIDYEQLFAQVLYEVCEQKLPYWFTPAETRQIEEQNVKFQHIDDLESMLNACFRRPEAEEIVHPLMTSEVVGILANSYPDMKVTAGMNVKVGRLLSAMNFERKVVAKGTVYYIVPMKKSA